MAKCRTSDLNSGLYKFDLDLYFYSVFVKLVISVKFLLLSCVYMLLIVH
ncbi:hypothetical protein VIBNISOn1_90018 [Vibrio nigripulchritudo SOn1]|uniref:Uncharacterized protein n=1 Tax=Vibrio nigripulchritudo SOn1 TaxID=1238450 RepID=A0AAV2VYE0_9VIBR|nr:hypothetical protein VIBNISOn1_90018 [Vibrio nigripulchritudo SOn1]